MNSSVRLRLSVMMFLQYFVWGSWFVTLGTYLGATRKFDNTTIGMCFATFPIAGMITPFFMGIFADRLFAAERLLACLHFVGAIILYYYSTSPADALVFPILLGYALCYMPTLSLSNTVCLHQMRDPAKEFSWIRVLGTLGWIVAGILVGFLLRLDQSGSLVLTFDISEAAATKFKSIEPTTIPIKIAAFSSLMLALSCLFLPHTPPKQDAQASVSSILGLDALGLMKNFSFSVFVIGSFLICIPLQFYYMFMNPFLTAAGMPYPAAKMIFGQISEFAFLLIMPFFFVRLGVKYMLLVGMGAWILRYVLFSVGGLPALYAGIVLHGICYDFFFVTGQIYVDQKAPNAIRGAAQGFIAFATLGFGQFIGSVLGGRTLDLFVLSKTKDVTIFDWSKFWLVPAAFAFVVMILFGLLFNDRDVKPLSIEPEKDTFN